MADTIRTYLRDASTPLLTDTLGLTMMPKHIDTLVGSALFFTIIHLVVAPKLSLAFFPEAYGKADKKFQNNWSIHVVSLVHSLIIIVLAVWASDLPALEKDRAFAWDDRVGLVASIAAGYFVWDTVDAIVNFVDIGFVIHGMACGITYILGFRPFSAYYGPRCLFWECSTVFLNIHWFLDKTGRSGSTLQLINGFFLIGTFFGVRLMMGAKTSYDFWHTLYGARNEIPLAYFLIYGVGNVSLQSLNWFWFSKMISALRKRFDSSPAKVSKAHKAVPPVYLSGHHAKGNRHHQ